MKVCLLHLLWTDHSRSELDLSVPGLEASDDGFSLQSRSIPGLNGSVRPPPISLSASIIIIHTHTHTHTHTAISTTTTNTTRISAPCEVTLLEHRGHRLCYEVVSSTETLRDAEGWRERRERDSERDTQRKGERWRMSD